MNKGEATRKMLDGISKNNMELDDRADFRRGVKMERKRILDLIKRDSSINYSVPSSINIFKRKLRDAIGGISE